MNAHLRIDNYCSYRQWNTPGIVHVLRIAERLTLLASVPTSTRIIAGDVTADSFAFLCNGQEQKSFIELHVHPIPGSQSLVPANGMLLHLKGFPADVRAIALIGFARRLTNVVSMTWDASTVPVSLFLTKDTCC
jgi:hypothetical protein